MRQTKLLMVAICLILITVVAIGCKGTSPETAYTPLPAVEPAVLQYVISGVVLFYEGRYDEAIAEYNKAIELDPNYFNAYYNRGYAYCDRGDYDQALADFNKTIELNPGFSYAYTERGNIYLFIGEYDLAISDYTKAIELNGGHYGKDEPELVETYQNRGNAYFNIGEYDQAIANYTKAIELAEHEDRLLAQLIEKELAELTSSITG